MDEKLELVREWLTKSTRDLAMAAMIAEDGGAEYLDGAAFHCQQAAEKAIKALLVFHDQRFSKIHDLEVLIEQAKVFVPALSSFTSQAERLTDFAAEGRYPGELEPADEAEYEDLARASDEIYRLVVGAVPPEARPEQGA